MAVKGPVRDLKRRQLGLLPALTLAAACAGRDLPAGYVIWQGDVPEAKPITRDVMLVADNQQHHLLGRPVWIRTALVDKAVTTAIRAPQLDLFGPSVLEWVIEEYADISPVIHLGDGLDLSCLAEYERFLASMRRAKRGWFMAPGNHDGIYFGSSAAEAEWRAVCDGGGGPFTQAMFVERYLADVIGRRDAAAPADGTLLDPGTVEFAKSFDGRKTGNWAYQGTDPGAWLTRVAWHVDHEKPFRSYLIQELTATRPGGPPVKYVLLDTSNYAHSPQLIPIPPHVNPGSTGDLATAQLDQLGEWISAYRRAQPAPVMVFFGHHPFHALTRRAQHGFETAFRSGNALLYVSAHTHRGQYFVSGDDSSSWVELNVGSLVDWPLEFRNFRLLSFKRDDGSAGIYTNSPLFELGRAWNDEGAPVCDPGWQPKPGDPDYYVDYTRALELDAEQTAKLIFDSLLNAYARLIANVPSAAENTTWPPDTANDARVLARIKRTISLGADTAGLAEKRKWLTELEVFDRGRIPSPPSAAVPATTSATSSAAAKRRLRDYRLCQAIWASQDDEKGVRRARNEDWYLVYPPAKR